MKIMEPIEIITTGEIIQKVSLARTPVSTEDVTAATVMKDLQVTMTGELHAYGSEYNRDYLNYGSERGANDRIVMNTTAPIMKEETIIVGRKFGGGNYGSDYNRGP